MSQSFIDQFEVPSLEELMNLYVYRSGAGLYDQLLRNEMESFDASAFEVDYSKAIEKVEQAIERGDTSAEVTVVIPLDIETNVDVKINYVLDVTHKVNITVDQCVAFEYEQEVSLDVNPLTECLDPITGYEKSVTVPNDGDEYKLALFDNDELTSFRKREGREPSFTDLEAMHGEGSAALSPESGFDGETTLFTISAPDRAEVDSFGKAGSDWALYNATDDTFGSHEGWAGTGNIVVASVSEVLV